MKRYAGKYFQKSRFHPLTAKVGLDWLGPDYATREELLIRGYDLPCYP
jgi:hypothetical protein